MQNFNEIRVRPLRRFGVTIYESNGVQASSRSIGEYPNLRDANEVAGALQKMRPGFLLNQMEDAQHTSAPPDLEYVIVATKHYEVETLCYFAYSETDAQAMREQAMKTHEMEFQIFSRLRDPASGPV